MATGFSINGTSSAKPDAVYDLIADLQSHLEWNGARQAKDFRLLSLSAPSGPASVGAVFESIGSIPMTSRTWQDRSTVTAAERPRLFEFRTEATVPYQNGSRMEAVVRHRYEIEASGEGSRVVYTMSLESMKNGMWRLAWPVMGAFMWKFGVPMKARPGFKALLRMAEAREANSRTPAKTA